MVVVHPSTTNTPSASSTKRCHQPQRVSTYCFVGQLPPVSLLLCRIVEAPHTMSSRSRRGGAAARKAKQRQAMQDESDSCMKALCSRCPGVTLTPLETDFACHPPPHRCHWSLECRGARRLPASSSTCWQQLAKNCWHCMWLPGLALGAS